MGSTRRNGGGRLRCIIRKVRMSVISECEHEQPNPPLEPMMKLLRNDFLSSYGSAA
jgi:hypothetical protein